MEYFMDYSEKMTGIYTALGVLCGLVLLWTLILTNSYKARNPSEALGPEKMIATSFKFIYYLLNTFGNLMYMLIWFTCMSVFVAYKYQMNTMLLLPELGDASAEVYSWL